MLYLASIVSILGWVVTSTFSFWIIHKSGKAKDVDFQTLDREAQNDIDVNYTVFTRH